MGAETVRVRLAHGCYPRLWNRAHDPAAAADGLRDAFLLWQHRYFSDALLLAVQAVLHEPASLAFWRRCAQLARLAVKSAKRPVECSAPEIT